MSFAEEIRATRDQAATIRRADRVAEREQDRADRRAAADRRQAARQQAAQRRDQRRDQRRASRARMWTWVATHPVDVLSAAIIVVPALLAWTAMADYGIETYGPLGALLPLFTEASMWAFAFRLGAARASGAPTGWLKVGLWVFTALAGALNAAHGLVLGGVSAAVLMALVSVGGVIAHQILTAAPMRPRRTRQQRLHDQLQQQADARVQRLRSRAMRAAIGYLDAEGRVELIHEPGLVTLRRRWWGALRLSRITMPGHGLDGPENATPSIADEVEHWLRATPTRATPPPPTADTPDTTCDQRRDTPPEPREQTRRSPRRSTPTRTRTSRKPESRSIEQLRTELTQAVADGRVNPASAESIRTGLRVGRDRAKQLRDEWGDGGAPAPTPA